MCSGNNSSDLVKSIQKYICINTLIKINTYISLHLPLVHLYRPEIPASSDRGLGGGAAREKGVLVFASEAAGGKSSTFLSGSVTVFRWDMIGRYYTSGQEDEISSRSAEQHLAGRFGATEGAWSVPSECHVTLLCDAEWVNRQLLAHKLTVSTLNFMSLLSAWSLFWIQYFLKKTFDFTFHKCVSPIIIHNGCVPCFIICYSNVIT